MTLTEDDIIEIEGLECLRCPRCGYGPVMEPGVARWECPRCGAKGKVALLLESAKGETDRWDGRLQNIDKAKIRQVRAYIESALSVLTEETNEHD